MVMLRSQPVGYGGAAKGVCGLLLAAAILSGCTTRLDSAPVVDRSDSGTLSTLNGQPGAQPGVPPGPPPPGYYRVKPGDTLYRIALASGVNYRDISAWNNLTNPNQIEVDQLIRIAPPGTTPPANGYGANGVSSAPIGSAPVQTSPLGPGQTTGQLAATPSPYGGSPSAPSTSNGIYTPPPVTTIPNNPAPSANQGGAAAEGPVAFTWPVRGALVGTFDDAKNKGINIAGNAGDPIKAAADGRVVYAGNGLRGYGNLIIIKHNSTFLTAYAHNRALRVKEGDAVTKGQVIAEMGNSDSDRVMLHFEVRRQGKPVDPLQYLPPQ
jgi:lipoprotein NlpD